MIFKAGESRISLFPDCYLPLCTEAVNPERRMVDFDLAGRIAAAGLDMYVYTVDSEEEMNRLLDLGARGLFTNTPDRMRGVVERRAS